MRKKFEQFEADDGTQRRYVRHPRGGGWVEVSAVVDPTAHVAEAAYVDPGARVEAEARIGPGAWIDRDALVRRLAVVGSAVHVGPG
ncbi:MAG: transferase, partial [Actinobacteria bacterium]|nr:transferase [Actinomycetota bacterium]